MNMVAFNYARWIAKRITSSMNVDRKIFIIGGPGTGKSMTGFALAKKLAKWVSYYKYGNFDHADEFFKFDKDHIAVINTLDLIHVMTAKLVKHSIKIIDDCGSAQGFTGRRAMSAENIDMASIYGTNRTDNGVTIYCVQDETFTDLRMRKLADDVIDLNDYIQRGPLRIGKLWKLKRDKQNNKKINKARFMTYDNGHWLSIESFSTFLPEPEDKKKYDELRKVKEAENSRTISERYTKIIVNDKVEQEKQRCPYCNSIRLYYSSKYNRTTCRGCGKTL